MPKKEEGDPGIGLPTNRPLLSNLFGDAKAGELARAVVLAYGSIKLIDEALEDE